MMWRYYELLTDVQISEIEKMKTESHPMQAKKDLAARIVTDFHSVEAAVKASEDWAKLRNKELQRDGLPDINEVQVKYERIRPDNKAVPGADNLLWIRLDRLLVECGLADSVTDAGRKLKASSVELLKPDGAIGAVETSPHLAVVFQGAPVRLILRVGKKTMAALIDV
jgi:tyrosyl-tRNA synthetase